MELLERLATDPGIVAIMKERELVVGALGEMDPIDDRIMQKMESHGSSCLLGYNTNHGLRIDIKLRTDDLSGFRPYPELVSTLIHELSHNWVSEHDLLFWTNYGQMKTEYLYTHQRLRKFSSNVVNGKKPYQLAGLSELQLDNVFQSIQNELMHDMRQHGLHPDTIANPIRERIRQLDEEHLLLKNRQGHRLGGGNNDGDDTMMMMITNDANPNNNNNNVTTVGTSSSTARYLALVAAERRARQQQQQQQKEKDNNRN